MKSYVTTFLVALMAASNANAKLEAHEWGTFTSLVGSDGITQDGMYHEDEKLPSFVYEFGETRPNDAQVPTQLPTATPAPHPRNAPPAPTPYPCRSKGCFSDSFFKANPITQKMETPVIYFYTDKAQRVDVRVRFPEGVITETYPAPVKTSPTRADLKSLGNGDTTFSVDLLTQPQPLKYVESTNIYSHARRPNANLVKSGSDVEKFIFYRGLGRFQPRIKMTSARGQLTLAAPARSIPQAAFLIDVNEAGDTRMVELAALSKTGSEIVSPSLIRVLRDHGSARPHPRLVTNQFGAMMQSLQDAGLDGPEAYAMLKTWEHGYLKVPGLRMLYVLPRAEVEEILPLEFTPKPEKVERVFVGRIEILLDTDEERILDEVRQPFFDVKSLGRFAESMLRRVAAVYRQAERANGRVPDATFEQRLEALIDKAAKMEMSGNTTAH